jgi:pantoate--beta-alanine ligase
VEVITEAGTFARGLDRARAEGRTVGLVPTMGALHRGHGSLVVRAAAECDVVAVTVFVNPLQFDDPADLAAYPATLEHDVALAADAGATLVFAPGLREIYPSHPQPPATKVHVAGLADVLEGRSRPGHLDGVATVVAKLFSLAGRCRAYFGEKDYQQLVLVRRLAEDLSMPVQVVGCPIVRDVDGVACSSRNARLSAGGRRAATVLARALDRGRSLVEGGERRPEVLAGEDRCQPDYAVVVDPWSLVPPTSIAGPVRLLVAASIDGVRLIDNAPAAGVAPRPANKPENGTRRSRRAQEQPALAGPDRMEG